jgi:hypothetical protein
MNSQAVLPFLQDLDFRYVTQQSVTATGVVVSTGQPVLQVRKLMCNAQMGNALISAYTDWENVPTTVEQTVVAAPTPVTAPAPAAPSPAAPAATPAPAPIGSKPITIVKSGP